jgi:hypothetical protein
MRFLTESFIFTIRYKEGEDIALAEHRDASVATLNINLNSEEAGGYGGSELEFVDEDDPTVRRRVGFRPGMALLHKGALRHAALPIEHGERQNLIIWLFGARFRVCVLNCCACLNSNAGKHR